MEPMRVDPPSRQRSARNNAAMRDGDSSNGSPTDQAGDEVALDSDNDIADTAAPGEEFEGLSVRSPDEVLTDGLDEAEAALTGREEAEPDADELALPIDSYGSLTVSEIVEQAGGLSAGDMNAVVEYEESHRNRKTLLAKLYKLLKAAKGGE